MVLTEHIEDPNGHSQEENKNLWSRDCIVHEMFHSEFHDEKHDKD